MSSTAELLEITHVAGSSLVPKPLFDRLVNRIVKDNLIDRDMATRIMDQALAFIVTCGANDGAPMAPSMTVDIGWHTFILYTRDYSEFCYNRTGRFVHHVPDDEEGSGSSDAHAVLERTAQAIHNRGFIVDEELWLCEAKCIGTKCRPGSCTQCHDQPRPRTN